ncbi:MAG: hypothetical protein QXX64_01840 [Nitrososphaera sp.]|uniref:Uncharacterized protein n=1 Tax=Nitrososphaera gargensis (strain Ga9.2) TaxID=1237085 RepID=K0IEM6_NITGG|nr:hypothetical protein [Candidatus Nitrososphaera gargensis]AFU57228.1 hypothetical protein Ngar_c02800 [Candidatus Nitrososphaera gargensis Ga9.2]
MIRPFLFIALVAAAATTQAGLAYGHFFGDTKNVDRYQVVFAPNPSNPTAGDNSTLNFSVLENNANIYNIYAAVMITDQSGRVVDQVPYKLYEFSDITIPYSFRENGRYTVTLQTRIIGDEKYQSSPLEASFDITVGLIPFDELMLFYVTPAAVAIAGIAIYLHSKKKL